MRILPSACLLFVVLAGLASDERHLVHAKKPTRPSISTSTSARRPPTSSGSRNSKSSTRPSKATPTRRKRPDQEEEEDDNDNEGDESFRFPGEEEEDDDIDGAIADDDDDPELDEPPRRSPIKKRPQSAARDAPPPRSGLPPRGGLPTRGGPPQSRKVSTRRSEEVDDDNDDDYYERPKTRRGGPPPSRGRVVPYANQPPGAFTRGLTALREAIPDPGAVRDAALSSISAARETSSKLTANLYREVKGLTSSELEQVMLKATRPDDSPVKGKHVERLVGVTYQISGRYDIYDAVLRKLWGKMAERDWRTTIKALYILHRFSADGAPEHQPALKARLRELRRTRDPKRKDKYFNSKQLLAGDSTPENIKFRAFLSRYAHYVLLRAQCFGGVFDEIANEPPKVKKAPKPMTATALRSEHLEAATMVLKAGVACQLKDGEECENTALAVERVASDLIALSNAVALALNRALKGTNDVKGTDAALLQKWCEFYSQELLPQTRSMVKKTSSKLDAYGLFLPSRMGSTVSQDLLQKGLKPVAVLEEAEEPAENDDAEEISVTVEEGSKEDIEDAKVDEEKEESEDDIEIEEKEIEEKEEEGKDDEVDDFVKGEGQEAFDDYEYYDEEEE